MHVGIGVHVVCKIDMVEDEFSIQNSKEHLGTQCVYVYIFHYYEVYHRWS